MNFGKKRRSCIPVRMVSHTLTTCDTNNIPLFTRIGRSKLNYSVLNITTMNKSTHLVDNTFKSNYFRGIAARRTAPPACHCPPPLHLPTKKIATSKSEEDVQSE